MRLDRGSVAAVVAALTLAGCVKAPQPRPGSVESRSMITIRPSSSQTYDYTVEVKALGPNPDSRAAREEAVLHIMEYYHCPAGRVVGESARITTFPGWLRSPTHFMQVKCRAAAG